MKRLLFWLIAGLVVSCYPESRKETRMVIEYAPFELQDGVTENDLLQASAALQTNFVEKQKGFVRRELVKVKDRHYADIVYWLSKADADSAVTHSQTSAACAQYFGLMKMQSRDASESVFHFEQISSYEKK